LGVVRQCELLALSRSTLYYQPVATPSEALALMRRIGTHYVDPGSPRQNATRALQQHLAHDLLGPLGICIRV
jgi:hypothetical protein